MAGVESDDCAAAVVVVAVAVLGDDDPSGRCENRDSKMVSL